MRLVAGELGTSRGSSKQTNVEIIMMLSDGGGKERNKNKFFVDVSAQGLTTICVIRRDFEVDCRLIVCRAPSKHP